MHRNSTICFVALWLTGFLPSLAAPDVAAHHKLSIAQLEQQLAAIDAELDQLASYTMCDGMGAAGYRSQIHQNPDAYEWIQIELDEAVSIDQIVLVPSLWRESKTGLLAEGFPAAFRLLAGTAHTTNVVASFSEEDRVLPRIAPLAVNFPPVKASWIRLDSAVLSPRIFDGKFMLQLSEIMVFSGMDNVALGRKVSVPAQTQKNWNQRFLADGFTPYLMDAARGDRSQSQQFRIQTTTPPPTLTIDLKAPYPVSQVNLHAADIALSIPTQYYSDKTFPRHIRISGANRADFSDETLLGESRQQSFLDTGHMIMRRFPETTCRYIRMTILDARPIISLEDKPKSVAFSEIEVLSNCQNIALGAPVAANSSLSGNKAVLKSITDGLNYYGKILPLRDWMNQLARRHDLERERPCTAAELNARYANQKARLLRVSWLAALLAAGTVISILVIRLIDLRQMENMRVRFAADLHDELGANIHSIGLLSDFAERAVGSPDKLKPYLQRIRAMTERTGFGIRHCTDMLEARSLFTDLKTDMQRTAERIVTEVDHSFSVEGERHLRQLSPRASKDLFLFYKESLININRHADASRIVTRLSAGKKGIELTVSDNGCGFSNAAKSSPPAALTRRAKLLKANLTVESAPAKGTCITLNFRPRRWRIKP